MIFKIIGALGLLLISIGIITKTRKTQDIYYIFGGICLELYSMFLGDMIFIVLQAFFTVSACYDLAKTEGGNKNETGKIQKMFNP